VPRRGNGAGLVPQRVRSVARAGIAVTSAAGYASTARFGSQIRETAMDRVKSEDVIAGKGRPFTGAEYLESLRDGREVYVYGERVKDVTTHPAFRNAARSIGRLYDALHDERTKGVLTGPTDTGSSGFTHKFFRAAHSREELVAQRDAIALWARMSYGWMGRSPD
jgi:4-hydroxyphenylacetate 3-monooxygenase